MERKKLGRLTLVTGPMFAGKTDKLIDKAKTKTEIIKIPVLYFKSYLDNRDSPKEICSHNGAAWPVIAVRTTEEIFQRSKKLFGKRCLIIIDEVQFLPNFQTIKLVLDLLLAGCDLMVGGLNTNYRGEPWGPILSLLPYAQERIFSKDGLCTYKENGEVCGETAHYSQRIIKEEKTQKIIQIVTSKNEPLVKTGAKDGYAIRCLKHFIWPSDFLETEICDEEKMLLIGVC